MEDTEKKKLSKSNKIRIIVVVSVVAVVLLSAVIAIIVYAGNVIGYDDSYKFAVAEGCSDFYYKNLSTNQRKLYEMMYKEAYEAQYGGNSIDTLGVYRFSDYDLSKEEALTVWYALRYDAASLFVISNMYVNLPDSIVLKASKEFSSKEARQKVFDSVQNSTEQVRELLDGIDDEALRFKIIYDYVMDRTFYQRDENDNDVYDGYTCSIVGVLDGDESTGSICQGYAKTLSYLCNIFGLNCVYVGSERAGHALNIVNVKDKWYYADSNTEDRFNNFEYKYFLNGRDGIWFDMIASSGNASRDYLINCLPELEINSYGEYGILVSDGALTYRISNRNNCALEYCDSEAKSVVIPSSLGGMTVRIASGRAFSHCGNLESLTVEDENERYKSEGNCIIDKATNTLIAGCKSSVIPNYVTAIGYAAFIRNSVLTSFAIPENVTSIGDFAFYDCGILEDVFIPSSVINMGRQVFGGCEKLTVCCQVSERPDGWDAQWSYAHRVIWGGLSAGTTDGGIKWALSAEGVMCIVGYDEEANNQVVIPSTINGYDVIKITQDAFRYRSDLISVYIPSEVAIIEAYAFSFNGSISIYCEASRQPEEWHGFWNYYDRPVVWNCAKESGVTDDGVKWCLTSDNTITISGCMKSDTQIVLVLPSEIAGRSVTGITKYAFKYLDNLTSVDIPKSVTYISSNAFYNCYNLTIYCEAESQPSGWDEDWNYNLRPVVWNCKEHGITDNGIKWNLTAEGITQITGYVGDDTQIVLPSVINGRSVTGIADNAFRNYNKLICIDIPKSVTSIGSRAFAFCNKLTIYCEAESQPSGWDEDWNYSSRPVMWNCKKHGITDNGILWSITAEGVMVVSGYVGDAARVEIPSEINGRKVTDIGKEAFYGYESLISVEIPLGIIKISGYAFYNCRCLTIYCEDESKPDGWDVNWKYGCPVVWDCKNNDVADNGNIYYVSDDGLRYALKDGEATVASQPREISGKVIIPETVTYKGTIYKVTAIGYGAFEGCDRLTDLVIPYGVTEIGNYAFTRCTGLKSIEIPDGVTNIGFCAFFGCSSLTAIIIPRSVISIEANAFDFNSSKLTIYCEAESQPSGWHISWKPENVSVVWNYKNNN